MDDSRECPYCGADNWRYWFVAETIAREMQLDVPLVAIKYVTSDSDDGCLLCDECMSCGTVVSL